MQEINSTFNLSLTCTERNCRDVNTEEQLSGEDFYAAYELYLNGNRQEVIQSLEELGFNLESNFLIKLEPEGQADSLVFVAKDGQSRVIFHTVDLLYTKFVDATFTTSSKGSKKSVDNLVWLWLDMGLKTGPIQCSVEICYLFEDQNEIWVVDKRWKKWNYEKYTSLYRHLIFADENHLFINLTETIPLNIVSSTDVPISEKF